MSISSQRQGAQTINLRSNPDVMAEALRSPRGPASYMQDRIRREMVKTFGDGDAPDFWFVIETDTATRFHLHGAVVTPECAGAVEMVNAALRKAGGPWAASGGHHRQHVTRSLDDPIWWASYAIKNVTLGGHRIERKLFASTLGMRITAMDEWPGIRALLPKA